MEKRKLKRKGIYPQTMPPPFPTSNAFNEEKAAKSNIFGRFSKEQKGWDSRRQPFQSTVSLHNSTSVRGLYITVHHSQCITGTPSTQLLTKLQPGLQLQYWACAVFSMLIQYRMVLPECKLSLPSRALLPHSPAKAACCQKIRQAQKEPLLWGNISNSTLIRSATVFLVHSVHCDA